MPVSLRPSSSIVPGYRLDRYELLCPIAEGGMASVWIARLQGKHGFEKLVAIKTILPQHSSDEQFQRMFLDEARISSGIEHANVAQILDLGDDRGMLYLVMEWVDGDSLSKLVGMVKRKGKLVPHGIAMRLVADACGGLHAAHELRGKDGATLGVVHRDVSPQNILVTVRGQAKVIDFGIAKARNRLAGDTSAGVFKGKVQYMAPEQALGKPLDRRADIWSIGAVLYHLVSGRPPYDGPNSLATLHMLTTGGSPPPLPDEVSPALRQVIGKALSFAPEDRYQTAADVQRALEETMVGTGLLTSVADVAAYNLEHLADRARARRDSVELAMSAATERARVEGLLQPAPWDTGTSELSPILAVARGPLPPPPRSSPEISTEGAATEANGAVHASSEAPLPTLSAVETTTAAVGADPVAGARRARWPVVAAAALLLGGLFAWASFGSRAPAPAPASMGVARPIAEPAPPRASAVAAETAPPAEATIELDESNGGGAPDEKPAAKAADVHGRAASTPVVSTHPRAVTSPADSARGAKKSRRDDYGF